MSTNGLPSHERFEIALFVLVAPKRINDALDGPDLRRNRQQQGIVPAPFAKALKQGHRLSRTFVHSKREKTAFTNPRPNIAQRGLIQTAPF